jgi:hypothetical protein
MATGIQTSSIHSCFPTNLQKGCSYFIVSNS